MKQRLKEFFKAQRESLAKGMRRGKHAMALHPKKVVLLALCAALCVAAVGYLASYLFTLQKNSAIYGDLQSTVVSQSVAPTPTASAAPQVAQETPVSTESPQLSIDFDALAAVNPDIYAWIDIPGTEVSYPIAQHATDDSYYLNYTIEGVYGLPGSIYTERCDATDFSDFNTVIYGHNMANDTMFGSLNNYRDADYFAAHSEIFIYTETETRVYEIFAAVVYDDRYLPYVYDDESVADCEAFLLSLYQNANAADLINPEISVSAESEIITLSTCIGNMPDNRYLVVAVYTGNQ